MIKPRPPLPLRHLSAAACLTLAIMLAGCGQNADVETWEPQPWHIGDRYTYAFADGDTVTLAVEGLATVLDAAGESREAVAVEFVRSGGDAAQGKAYVDLESRLLLRIDESTGPQDVSSYGQAHPDGFVRGQIFGPHPWALAALLQGRDWQLGFRTEVSIGTTNLGIHPVAVNGGIEVHIDFQQNGIPEPSHRQTAFRFNDSGLPIQYGELLGIGEGFVDARLVDIRVGKTPVAWRPLQDVQVPPLGTPFALGPRMAPARLPLLLEDAVDAALRHPEAAAFAEDNPRWYVAFALYSRDSVSGTPSWIVQLGDSSRGEVHAVDYRRIDCAVQGVSMPTPVAVAVDCGELLEPTPVEYGIDHIGMRGLVNLAPLLDRIMTEFGEPQAIRYVVQAEIELWQGAEEVVLEARSQDRMWLFSAVDGRPLRISND